MNKYLKLITILLPVTFVYWYCWQYIHKENYFYFFDMGQHFAEFIQVRDLLVKHGFITTIQKVVLSIQTEDYNLLSAFILSPFSLISTSRWSYLAGIITIFYLPSYLLFIKIIELFNKKMTFGNYLLSSSLFIFSSTILTPIVRNQSSIDGSILVLLTLYIFIREILHRHHPFTPFILGLSLGLLPILHRWYLFYSISFLTIYTIYNSKLTLKSTRNLFVVYSMAFITFLAISGNLWKRFVFTNYHQEFSNFKIYHNYFLSLNDIFSRTGYLLILIAVLSLLFLFINKVTRNASLILFGLLTLTTCLFLSVQDFNNHHYYLIIYPILLAIGITITQPQITRIKYLVIPIMLLNLIVSNNTALQYSPFSLPFSQEAASPINFPETNNIIPILDDLLMRHPQLVYVLADTSFFNFSGITYYSCYFNTSYIDLCHHIGTSIFYRSDSLPYDFKSADFILALNNLPDSSFSPSARLRKFISDNQIYYQKVEHYTINGDFVTATLYQVNGPIPDSKWDELFNSLSLNEQ